MGPLNPLLRLIFGVFSAEEQPRRMARGFWLFCLTGFLYYKGFELLFLGWSQTVPFEKLIAIFLLPPVVVGGVLAVHWVRSLKVPEFKMPEPSAPRARAAGNEHWSEDS